MVQVASEDYDYLEKITYDSETGRIEYTITPEVTLINIVFAFGAMSDSEAGTYDIELSNIKLYEIR